MNFLFGSLKPFLNPVGFGASDFIEFGLAALLLAALLSRDRVVRGLAWLAARPALAVAVIAILPVLLRLALLSAHPPPVPRTAEEIANTVAPNTSHPMARFIAPASGPKAIAPAALFARAPWPAALLATAVFAATCYWMLLAALPPAWALGGGLFAAIGLGPLHAFANTYSGAAISAAAGCVACGAAWRLGRGRRILMAIPLLIALAIIADGRAVASTAAQPAINYVRAFLFPPLYLGLAGFAAALADRRFAALALIVAGWISLGGGFGAMAVVAGPLLLIAVEGARRLNATVAALLVTFCLAHFGFWYGVHLFEPRPGPVALRAFESWSGLSHTPDRRAAAAAALGPGRHLILVPQPSAAEWIVNDPDADGAPMVWARDLGAAETGKLLGYFKDRKAWRIDLRFTPARLSAYEQPLPSPPPEPPWKNL